jgi:hypothetical protein
MFEGICGRVMASNEGASPSVIVDDSGRLRVLDPETNSHSRLVAESCTVFQSKLQHFQNVTHSKHLSSCLRVCPFLVWTKIAPKK